MAGKKIFPSSEVDDDNYDEVHLRISFRLFRGQIQMMFSDDVRWIRMTSAGARKVAVLLNEKAAELDRLGVPAAAAAPVSSEADSSRPATAPTQEKKKSMKPRKRVAVNPVTR